MKRITILLVLMLSLTSCNQKEEVKTVKSENKETIIPQEPLLVNSFKDFPEALSDAPACYFSVDKSDFTAERYIYADNTDSICFIKIKGQFIKLEMTEDKSPDSLSVDHYIKKFKNDEYQLSIDVKKVDEEDEVSILEGFMLIKYKDKPEEKKDLYGICGC